MKRIAHRINTTAALRQIPKGCGVEVDLRDCGNRLILQHDPFQEGEDFELFLKNVGNRFLILNIKSERVEWRVRELLQEYNIRDYFFLDSSFPMIVRLAREGENNIALRFSELEGTDTLLRMQGKAKWIWVDSFTRMPLDKKTFAILREAGYQLCLASPDLLGRPQDIPLFKKQIQKEGIEFQAVCAKMENLPQWQKE